MQVPIKQREPMYVPVVAITALLLIVGGSCSRPSVTTPAPEVAPAISTETAIIEGALPAILTVIDRASAALTEADVDAVDAALDDIEKAGLLAEVEAGLSNALAVAEAAGQAAPGLHLALAAVYGRKGLAGKAYAAVQAAEAAALAPGVRFSLAAIHGRKALLAPGQVSGAYSITVSCDQSGAVTALDGGVAMPVPATFEALRPGRHEVTVRLAGYELWSSIINGKDGDRQSVQSILIPAKVHVTVTTEPSGATISVDGGTVVQSPWTGFLNPGTYTVSATAELYNPAVSQLVVPFGKDRTEIIIKLVPVPARALIKSDPPGESVQLYIDGEYAGIAPLELPLLVPGRHTVKSINGPTDYGPSPAVTFDAIPGETVVVVVKPVASFCILEFTGLDLDGAFLSINGLYVGMLPDINRYRLAPGTYKVELQQLGFKPFRRTLEVTLLGVNTSIEVSWVKEEVAATSVVWGTDKPSFVVPRRNITVDGKLDDWAGTEPACSDRAGDDRQPLEPGTNITQAFFVYDDKYVYARIDLADGGPAKRPAGAAVYSMRLVGDTQKDGSRVTFAFQVEYRDGAWLSQVLKGSWHGYGKNVSGWSQVSQGFAYKFGDGVLEMRIQRSTLEKYFKVHEKPMIWANYFINNKWDSTGDDTEYRNISIAW